MIATTHAPESTSVCRDEERTLDQLTSALREEHREVLVLREIEEMDYRESAAVTNVSCTSSSTGSGTKSAPLFLHQHVQMTTFHDSQQPGLYIGYSQAVESAKRAQERILNHIIRVVRRTG